MFDLEQFFDKFLVLFMDFDVWEEGREGAFAFGFLVGLGVEGFSFLDLEEVLVEELLWKLVLKGKFVVH